MLKPKEEIVMPLEERVSKIEGILEQMDKRLGSIETLYNKLDSKIDSIYEKLDSRIAVSNRWMIGLMLGSWITLMTAIFLK
jgi:tetrahydromethanopterin S-methyltransferase subunit B